MDRKIKCGDIVIFSKSVGDIPDRSMGIAAAATGSDTFFVYVFFYNSIEHAESDPETISRYAYAIQEIAKKTSANIVCSSDIEAYIEISDFFNEPNLALELMSVSEGDVIRLADANIDNVPVPIGYALYEKDKTFYVGEYNKGNAIIFNAETDEVISISTKQILAKFKTDALLDDLLIIKEKILQKDQHGTHTQIRKIAKNKTKKHKDKEHIASVSVGVMSRLGRVKLRRSK